MYISRPLLNCMVDDNVMMIGTYGVTQSLSNSFGGDVVLDSFIKVYQDSILDQTCSDFYFDDF